MTAAAGMEANDLTGHSLRVSLATAAPGVPERVAQGLNEGTT
jgi:hypothetical protein